MKHPATLLPLLLLVGLARGAVPKEWTVDIDRPVAAQFSVFAGETVALRCHLIRDRAPWDPQAASTTLYWQTNGMGREWWSAPAAAASNELSAVWTPKMDPGAPSVRLFIGARDAAGDLTYRAFANMTVLPSPGATPNALPLPVPIIDFATVAVTNAPWADASRFIPNDGGTFGGGYFYTGGQIGFGDNSGLTDSGGELLVAPADRAMIGNWLLVGDLEAQSLRTPALRLWDADEQRYRQLYLSNGQLYVQ